jgi:hypothetical protein
LLAVKDVFHTAENEMTKRMGPGVRRDDSWKGLPRVNQHDPLAAHLNLAGHFARVGARESTSCKAAIS